MGTGTNNQMVCNAPCLVNHQSRQGDGQGLTSCHERLISPDVLFKLLDPKSLKQGCARTC